MRKHHEELGQLPMLIPAIVFVGGALVGGVTTIVKKIRGGK